jgi:hypothetical protein
MRLPADPGRPTVADADESRNRWRGIDGMTAALFLRRAGVDAVGYEQAPEFGTVGGSFPSRSMKAPPASDDVLRFQFHAHVTERLPGNRASSGSAPTSLPRSGGRPG